MSLHASRANLNDSLKRLLNDWDAVREQWDDETSRRFFETHIAALQPIVRSTLGAMDQMAELLRQARRDCGDQ